MQGKTEQQLRWLTYAGSMLALSAIVLIVVLGSGLNASVKRAFSKIDSFHQDLAVISDIHTTGIKIAYMNVEEVFGTITAAVSYQRQRAIDTQNRLAELQQEYSAGNVTVNEYRDRKFQLQIELLTRQVEILNAGLDRMLKSELFSDLHSDLRKLSEEAQPLTDSLTKLYAMSQATTERDQLEEEYSKLHKTFEDFDKLVTNSAVLVITDIGKAIALECGYDIILRIKNVIIYGNEDKLVDITEEAKLRLTELMP